MALWRACRSRAQTTAHRVAVRRYGPILAGFVDNFLRGMRDLGYVEGRNFDMLYRFADGYGDRLPALTDEVVRLKPNVILASAIIAAFAASKATSTIPIVSPALADAVHLGLIASEARPGRQ